MEDLRNITPEEYTDKDMQVVTQLAYIDFELILNDALSKNNNEVPTIGYLIENYYDAIYKQYVGKYQDDDGNWPESGSWQENAVMNSRTSGTSTRIVKNRCKLSMPMREMESE